MKQGRRGRIRNRVSLDQRPHIVNQKSGIGEWEGNNDLGVVATLVERKNQYTLMAKSKTKHAEAIRKSIEQELILYQNRVHTITYDNGLEFAQHQKMA